MKSCLCTPSTSQISVCPFHVPHTKLFPSARLSLHRTRLSTLSLFSVASNLLPSTPTLPAPASERTMTPAPVIQALLCIPSRHPHGAGTSLLLLAVSSQRLMLHSFPINIANSSQNPHTVVDLNVASKTNFNRVLCTTNSQTTST